MKIDREQSEAVIQLHDIARFVERNFDYENLAIEIRTIADTLNKATPSQTGTTNERTMD